MKKIFLLMLLITTCCLVGQAQTASPAKKAMRLAPGTPMVNLQTGQTFRVAAPAPAVDNVVGRLSITTGGKPAGNSSTSDKSNLKFSNSINVKEKSTVKSLKKN